VTVSEPNNPFQCPVPDHVCARQAIERDLVTFFGTVVLVVVLVVPADLPQVVPLGPGPWPARFLGLGLGPMAQSALGPGPWPARFWAWAWAQWPIHTYIYACVYVCMYVYMYVSATSKCEMPLLLIHQRLCG